MVLLLLVFCHPRQPFAGLLGVLFAASMAALAAVRDADRRLIHAVALAAIPVYLYLLFNRFAFAPAADTWYYSGTAEMVRRGDFLPGSLLPLDPFVNMGQPTCSQSFMGYAVGAAARALDMDTLTAFLLSGLPVLVLLIYGIYKLFSYSFTPKHGLFVAITYIYVFIWHTPNFWTSTPVTYPMELLTMSWPPVQVQAFIIWMLYFAIKGVREGRNVDLILCGAFWALAMWTRTWAYLAPVLLLGLVPGQVAALRASGQAAMGRAAFLRRLLLPYVKIGLAGIILSLPAVLVYRLAGVEMPFWTLGIMGLNSLALWPSFFGWTALVLGLAGLAYCVINWVRVPLCAVLILWLAISIIGSVPNPIPLTWKWGYNLNAVRLLAPLGLVSLVQYTWGLGRNRLAAPARAAALAACAIILVFAGSRSMDFLAQSREGLLIGWSGFSQGPLYSALAASGPTFPYEILLWLNEHGNGDDTVACDSMYVSMHVHPYTPCYPASMAPAFFSYIGDPVEQWQRWESIDLALNHPAEADAVLECLSRYGVSYVLLVGHRPDELPQYQSPIFEIMVQERGATLMAVHYPEATQT